MLASQAGAFFFPPGHVVSRTVGAFYGQRPAAGVPRGPASPRLPEGSAAPRRWPRLCTKAGCGSKGRGRSRRVGSGRRGAGRRGGAWWACGWRWGYPSRGARSPPWPRVRWASRRMGRPPVRAREPRSRHGRWSWGTARRCVRRWLSMGTSSGWRLMSDRETSGEGPCPSTVQVGDPGVTCAPADLAERPEILPGAPESASLHGVVQLNSTFTPRPC